MNGAAGLPKLLTAKQVSAATGLPLATVYELSRRHELPAVRIGARALRYSAPAVAAWIANGGSRNGGDDHVDQAGR